MNIGTILYYVPHHGSPYEVIVRHIGRKWFTFVDLRFKDLPHPRSQRADVQTWQVDGGHYSTPGTLYVSKEIYEEVLELQRVWVLLRNVVERASAPPAGVRREDVLAALQLLKYGNTESPGI